MNEQELIKLLEPCGLSGQSSKVKNRGEGGQGNWYFMMLKSCEI